MLTRIFISLMLLLYAAKVSGQTFIVKPVPIVVLPFKEYSDETRYQYNNDITSQLFVAMKGTGKFDVLVNDEKALEAISEEVAKHEFVTNSSLDFEALKGATLLLETAMTNSESKYFPAERDSDGEITRPSFYRTTVRGTAKVIDINTREYLHTIETRVYADDASRRTSYAEAVRGLPGPLVDDLRKKFLIKAVIAERGEGDAFDLSGGEANGVKRGMWFDIYPINDSDITDPENINLNINKLGAIKVAEVFENRSRGRLREGFPDDIQEGWIAIETEHKEVKEKGNIVDKKFNKVFLDAGYDLGFEQGMTFEVIKEKEKKVGDKRFGTKKVIGEIYLEDIQNEFSSGKLLKGFYSVREGMKVVQAPVALYDHHINVAYGLLQNVFIPANDIAGNYMGEHTEDPEPFDYTNADDITSAWLLRFHYQYHNRLNNLNFGLRFDVRNFGGEFTNVAPMVDVGYDLFIIPQYFSLSPVIGVGFSSIRQRSDLITQISDEEDDFARSRSAYLSAGAKAILHLGSLRLFAGVDYTRANHNNWDFYLVRGDEDTESERGDIDGQFLPYEAITINNLTYFAGITYTFRL